MNRDTLLKLKNNPHYKLSPKQEAELSNMERPEMMPIGVPETHNVIESHHNQSFPVQKSTSNQKPKPKRLRKYKK